MSIFSFSSTQFSLITSVTEAFFLKQASKKSRQNTSARKFHGPIVVLVYKHLLKRTKNHMRDIHLCTGVKYHTVSLMAMLCNRDTNVKNECSCHYNANFGY